MGDTERLPQHDVTAVTSFCVHRKRVDGVLISADGRLGMSREKDVQKVWDMETARCLNTFEGAAGLSVCVALSPDGRLAWVGRSTAGWGQVRYRLELWNCEAGRCLRRLKTQRGVPEVLVVDWGKSLAWSGDLENTWSGRPTHTLRLWDLQNGKPFDLIRRPFGGEAIGISADGRWAVFDIDSSRKWRRGVERLIQALEVWDLKSLTRISRLEVTETREVMLVFVYDLVYVFFSFVRSAPRFSLSGDGTTIVFWNYPLSGDGPPKTNMKVWNLKTGECMGRLQGHSDWVLDALITPDGRRAVSSSRDSTLKVWNLRTAECQCTIPMASTVTSLAIAARAHDLLCGHDDGTISRWKLSAS